MKRVFTLVLLSATAGTALAGDEVPAWMRQAAAAAVGSYDKMVPAVVLLNENSVRVNEDGKVTTTERYAVRILSNEGKSQARARVTYLTDSAKVRDMRAWMIRPSGEVKKYDRDDVLDVAAALNDVFNDVRAKSIVAAGDAEPGAVFGYEWTLEDRSVFTQFDWQFQERLPVLSSRFSITVPPGWRAEGVLFNHQKFAPVVSASSYTWELRNLGFIDDEPASPPVTNLAPRLAVSYFPPPGVRPGQARTFDSWADVSRWLTELSDPQAVVNGAIASKARQLTAAAATEWERIQAIGRYVQSVNYVSIQTGIGRGGGYKPHASTDVYAKSYGDCKDKANLMRAMLKAINIPAYLVSIYSGDPTYVREEWPSPQQFNHCIIAVQVSDQTKAATILEHPALGRLLIFDPTDENTPVGDLPNHEQGSLALIIAGDKGSLTRMPMTPPEANNLRRRAEVVLGPDGSITASLREESAGQSAALERRAFRSLSKPDYMKMVEQRITRGATGASVSKVEPSDNSLEGRFALDVTFTAARYGQVLQNRLLVFKPAIVARRESLFLAGSSRSHPIVIEAQAYAETVRIKLPEGFAVDEIPGPSKAEAPFGSYATTYEVKDGHLQFTRSMVLKAATIPVSDYAAVREFFELMRAAEQAPIVLARK